MPCSKVDSVFTECEETESLRLRKIAHPLRHARFNGAEGASLFTVEDDGAVGTDHDFLAGDLPGDWRTATREAARCDHDANAARSGHLDGGEVVRRDRTVLAHERAVEVYSEQATAMQRRRHGQKHSIGKRSEQARTVPRHRRLAA